MCNQIKALKVKIKSLAEEARIIRLEERRAILVGHPPECRNKYRDDALYVSLRDHRVKDVRQEQRCAMLAYAYLRGVPYKSVEQNAKKEISYARVRDLIRKFGGLPGFATVCEVQWVAEWVSGKELPAHRFATA